MTSAFFQKSKLFLLWAVVFAALYWISLSNYLLFHSLAELFSMVVAGTIFILAWNTRAYQDNGYLLFLGIIHLFISGIDLLHTFTFKGMQVFPGMTANIPTQLWIASRYLHSISMLIAPLYLFRSLKPWRIIAIYSLVSVLVILSIFQWGIFPDSYLDGIGLTTFKKISEYIISVIYLAAAGLLVLYRQKFDRLVFIYLLSSILVGITAELSFTVYVGVYDFPNMLGHLLKILAFYFIYKAIVETGLVRPFNLLFVNIKRSEEQLRRLNDELEIRVAERTAEVTMANQALRVEVNQHRETEAELVRYRDHLEQLVSERTSELQKEVHVRERAESDARNYANQLEISNRELQDFALIASHDLQEPLRKIITFGQRLKDKSGNGLGESEIDYIYRMQSSAERMQKMIEGLLAYSRVTTKGRPFVGVDLLEIIKGVMADLEVRIDQVGGTVDLGELPTIQADPIQMQQLFQNLIANALKFNKPSVPPVVKVWSEETIAYEVGGNGNNPSYNPAIARYKIFVEDNGIGFDERFLSRLFHPFQRLVGRHEYEGSGMGLAICRKIVERHGGKITACSQPGQGTKFIIELPGDKAHAA